MNKTDTVIAALLAAAAFLLRIWDISAITTYFLDESFHIPSALSLMESGTPLTTNWTHPPGGALILISGMKLFGNNPLGWRIGGVFFGSLSVAALYLLANRLFRSRNCAILTSLLLLFDPLHIYYSRTTMMEIPVICFFIFFLFFLVLHQETGQIRFIALAGIFLGLTSATKSYYALAAGLTVAISLILAMKKQNDRRLTALEYACWLVLLPLAVYLLSFHHFFGRGFTLPEFITMRSDALFTLRNITRDILESSWFVEMSGKPADWFLKPSVFGFRSDDGRYLLEQNNFPLRLLSLISIPTLCLWAWKRRQPECFVPPALFLAVYPIFLLLDRPVFAYSALALLPFAYLALARCVTIADNWRPFRGKVTLAAAILVSLWGLYLYPLAAGLPFTGKVHEPVTSNAPVVRMPP